MTKRLGDITFALTVLTLGSPLLLLIALAVKVTSSGPIFFGHKRLGKNGETFRCWKFRTMYPDAECRLVKLLGSDPELYKEYALTHKLKKDPRVTPLGHLLRVTSLDELPQVVNILRGEMSVIGPRPIIAEEVPHYGEHFHEVFSVLPGITGLWQSSGRNNLSYERRVVLDLEYVRGYSLRLDWKIFLRTVKVLLLPKKYGAY